jgi:Tol biopolymer transport system component
VSSLTKTGESFQVVPNGFIPSISNDGTLVYRSGGNDLIQLVWVNTDGQVEGPVGQPQSGTSALDLSSDDRWVAVHGHEPGAFTENLWIHDAERGSKNRLTFSPVPNADTSPVWSPTGDQFVFTSIKVGGLWDLVLQDKSSASNVQILLSDSREKIPSDWSSDGKYLLFSIADSKTKRDLWYLPMNGGDPVPFLQTVYDETFAQFSPNGKYVAYQSKESARWEVYVTTFPEITDRWLVSVNGGKFPYWRGDTLFFLEETFMTVVPVPTRPVFQPGKAQRLFSTTPFVTSLTPFPEALYDVTSNGRRFVISPSVVDQLNP